MTKPKVLITDDVHPMLINALISKNYEVDYMPDISLQKTIEIVKEYEGLVINSKIKADRSFILAADKLKWIGRLGSGMEIIDAVAARDKNIHLINTPEANCQAVAEHALAMILSLFRNLKRADSQVRAMTWLREENRGKELQGQTVGIIGFGHTGPAFAKLLSAFDVKILVFDKYKQHLETGYRYELVKNVETIQKEAGLISLHIPLNPDTKHLIDEEFINSCSHSFYLINTSRGPIVKTTDLIDALRSGKVLGACLDVFENEHPLNFSETERKLYEDLYTFDQVVLSPHIAGWTHESKLKIAEVLLAKLEAWLWNNMS
ncbi:MAG: hypothetical protein IPM34_02835 [Saprospiraceae bacterium]|nr:hypothetical protein [Saprospiraceae bacterium]